MSSFAAWGLTILGLAVITTIAEMLLPNGKTRKVIRSVMATLSVSAMVMPLPDLLRRGVDFDFLSHSASPDGRYIAYTEQLKCDYAANAAQSYLDGKGINSVSLTVEMKGYSVKFVRAKIVDSGITQNGEHINRSEITGLIAEFFGIGEEAVMVYE